MQEPLCDLEWNLWTLLSSPGMSPDMNNDHKEWNTILEKKKKSEGREEGKVTTSDTKELTFSATQPCYLNYRTRSLLVF